MASWKVGCGGVGYDEKFSEEQILEEIGRAGYEGAPLSPRGTRSVADTVALYARFGLKPAPGYFSADYWRAEQRDEIVAKAQQLARFHREAGCSEMYVATGGWGGYTGRRGYHRGQVAGQVQAEDSLTDDEWAVFCSTLKDVCEATLEEGVWSCFHNHVGSVIESAEELERLLSTLPKELLSLGPDTGHLAWAGVDPVAFCKKYASRIRTIHLKDVDLNVRAEGVRSGWDYDLFCQNHLFAELGDGDVDFPALIETLRSVGFAGWIIVETDVPRRASMFESNRVSREYLRRLGL